MKKNIFLIIHPLYGRTGTTWLQEKILPKLSILNLGKNESFKLFTENDSLISKQRKIFCPFNSDNDCKKRYRNSELLINDYLESIIFLIKENIKNKDELIAIISDETMLQYGGFEINLFSFYTTIYLLKEKLKSEFNLVISINITIREQSSFLLSHYSYDYNRERSCFKDFRTFIEFGIKNPNERIFGQLNYWSVYNQIRNIFINFDNLSINIIPFELLEYKKLYLKKFFEILPSNHNLNDEIEKISNYKNIVNSSKFNEDYRENYYPIQFIEQRIIKIYNSIKENLNNNTKNKLRIIFKIYKSSKLRFRLKRGVVKYKNNMQKEIRSIYKKSNKNLIHILDEDFLKKNNYI